MKKLIRIWRALHEYVNVVHDPEKQYRSLSEWSATGDRQGHKRWHCELPLQLGHQLREVVLRVRRQQCLDSRHLLPETTASRHMQLLVDLVLNYIW